MERQLDPKIDQFYRGNTRKENANEQLVQKWSPLIALENSSEEV
jgi:hypothetical protein